MVVCCSGVLRSPLSFSAQFNLLSDRRLYVFQTCLQLIQVFVRRGRVSPGRPKRLQQGNLGDRSESFSSEVYPIIGFPCSVLGRFQALRA
ncbi:hypothetical protein AVEN_211630-1 [Araneus ventricosus]|uniref:Uncharacterized protein n=1 Tax=Araneus ventricosus TaxID=182803 RepID=A0A4Y2V590_ARAVE|nr:hypothetical protein AVEN_211630-1 [Araneus ventricosus]